MHSAIPTYRVMDSNGSIVDPERAPSDVTEKEVTTWYRNMVSGMAFRTKGNEGANAKLRSEYFGYCHV